MTDRPLLLSHRPEQPTSAEAASIDGGIRWMSYVARWRLQLASRLLEQAGVSIGQAGAEVGYESEAAFNRAFKKFVGVTPGEWRRQSQVPAPSQ
jgi:AraC-like DNA-binding protein